MKVQHVNYRTGEVTPFRGPTRRPVTSDVSKDVILALTLYSIAVTLLLVTR